VLFEQKKNCKDWC